MKLKKMVAIALTAGSLLLFSNNDAEAVKTVAQGEYGSIVIDEASIFWDDNKEFNVLIYQLSPNGEVLKRGIFTFEYLKEYSNWYYHPLNDKTQYIRADVDKLENVPVIAMEELKKKKNKIKK